MHPQLMAATGVMQVLTVKPELPIVNAIAAHFVPHVLDAHTLHDAIVLQISTSADQHHHT